MQRALVDLNARWQAEGKPELKIHVGLNTGRVAAGNIGSERYLQYATIGDTTNVASRVCSAAAEREICISESTFHRCQERSWPLVKLLPRSRQRQAGALDAVPGGLESADLQVDHLASRARVMALTQTM